MDVTIQETIRRVENRSVRPTIAASGQYSEPRWRRTFSLILFYTVSSFPD